MLRRLLFVPLFFLVLTGCNRDPEAAKQKLVETGNRYFENGKFKEASIIYRRAIQKDRRYGEAYYRLGLAERKLGRIRQSVGALTRAAELQPENEDAYANLADLYLSLYLSNPSRNEAWLTELQTTTERAEQYFPDSYHVNRIKAYVALSQKDFDTSKELFRKALALAPDDAGVNLGLIQAMAASGEEDEALKMANDFIEANKTSAPMYDAAYMIHIRNRRFDEAQRTLERKIEANPDNISFRLQLARHHAALRHQEEMNAVLDEVIENAERFPTAYRDVATFQSRLGRLDAAIDVLRKGVEARPDQSILLRNMIVEILARQGKREEAFRRVEEILAEDPDNSSALALRGALRLSSGDRAELDAAVADFEAVLTQMPDNPVLRHNLAEAYRAQGNIDRAIVEYLAAIDKRKDYLAPRYSLASVYLDQGEHAKAVAVAEEILAMKPDDMQARLLRSNGWIGVGEKGQARESLEEIIKSNPNSRDALYHLGRLDLSEKRFQDAEKIFRSLYSMNPPDLRGLMGLTDVYLAQGHADRAIGGLEGALEQFPENVMLRVSLGGVLSQAGRHERAVTELETARAKRPDDPYTTRVLGMTYFRARQLDKAEDILTQAADLNPRDTAAPLFLGMIAELRGAMQEAITYYEAVLELDPYHAVALNNLAYILAETTADLDRALTLAQRARSLLPEDANIADTLGWIYIKKRVPESAIPILDDVVSRNPGKVIWRYHLAMALFEQGNKTRARKELETALTHRPSEEEKIKIEELLAKVG